MKNCLVINAAVEKLYIEMSSKTDLIKKLDHILSSFLEPIVKQSDEVLIGLHEMVVNAIEHGNNFNAKKKIRVRVDLGVDHLRIEVSDEGNGFDWEKKVYKPVDLNSYDERGRGIPITSLYFDNISYNECGNSVSLIKYNCCTASCVTIALKGELFPESASFRAPTLYTELMR